jgi:hypothetical protein
MWTKGQAQGKMAAFRSCWGQDRKAAQGDIVDAKRLILGHFLQHDLGRDAKGTHNLTR